MQSPIDLNTKALVYDPNLAPLRADNNLILGVLYNDRHSQVFKGSVAALVLFASLREPRKAKKQHAQQTGQSEPETGPGSEQPQEEQQQQQPTETRNGLFDWQSAAEGDNETRTSQSLARRDLMTASYEQDDHLESTNGALDYGRHMPLVGGPELSNNIAEASLGEGDLDLQSRRANEASTGLLNERQQPLETGLDELGLELLGPNASADQINGNSLQTSSSMTTNQIHFTGAHSAYSYRFEALQLKFGQNYEQAGNGSEHRIDGRSFAAELQLLAYNWQLYRNFDEAQTRPYGLLAVSILINTIPSPTPTVSPNAIDANERLETNGQKSRGSSEPPAGTKPNESQLHAANEQLERLLGAATNSLKHRGAFAPLRDLNVSALLPDTDHFVTYEGSLTQPGCHESVTWLILNRPLYIQRQSVSSASGRLVCDIKPFSMRIFRTH